MRSLSMAAAGLMFAGMGSASPVYYSLPEAKKPADQKPSAKRANVKAARKQRQKGGKA